MWNGSLPPPEIEPELWSGITLLWLIFAAAMTCVVWLLFHTPVRNTKIDKATKDLDQLKVKT